MSFAGFFWCTHLPRRIELLMLVIGFFGTTQPVTKIGLIV